MTRTRTQRFTADRPVTWSASAGSIDADGVFTAPDQPGGPITITAASVADETNTANATVTVADYGLELLAGKLGGWGHADGVGGAARFQHVTALAGDANGTIYVGDGDCTLRRYVIDTTTGDVSTLAGSAGRVGGDDGTGMAARFGRAEGVFLDGQYLYVADGEGRTIRRVTVPDGTVTTIAGQYSTAGVLDGVGTNARFSYPAYLTGDHQGHLFVGDLGAAIIRRMTLATGDVETIAGDPDVAEILDGQGKAAHFLNPFGIAFEGGTLYVCDVTAIRAIALSDFNVTTVAGGTTPGGADGVGSAAKLTNCLACAADGAGHLLVADAGTIRRFDIATRTVSTVLGKVGTLKGSLGPLSTASVSLLQGIALTAAATRSSRTISRARCSFCGCRASRVRARGDRRRRRPARRR